MQQYYAREWKSIAGGAAESDNSKGCYDCNICLDFANEPVVTLCGHLYCWPCIYKWLRVQSTSLASDECPQCPVCKTEISHTTMVPLYGRGTTPEPELKGKAPSVGIIVPPRPSPWDAQALVSTTRWRVCSLILIIARSTSLILTAAMTNNLPRRLLASEAQRYRVSTTRWRVCLGRWFTQECLETPRAFTLTRIRITLREVVVRG